MDRRFRYAGPSFPDVLIKPVHYIDEFFEYEIELESEVFYELRKKNNIKPYRLIDSTQSELENIRSFFSSNCSTFYFIFDTAELIGSVLWVKNYIQSLSVSKKYQGRGFGTSLTKLAVNRILGNGYAFSELNILPGNDIAEYMYRKIGFIEVS